MKVLLTHAQFAPDFAGGGEYDTLRIAQHLMNRGVHVRVLTTGQPEMTSFEGIETIRMPMHRYRMNFTVRRVMELAQDVDLIQTFNYHACLASQRAGKRLGKPVVCIVLAVFHRMWRQMRGPLLGRACTAWERFILTRDFSRLVFISEYSRQLGLLHGVSSDRSVVHTPGIEHEDFRPAAEKEDLVLFVGKLEARKGILETLSAARALPDVRFQVVGWGPEAEHLRSKAPANVEFLGFLTGAPLRAAFARASIFLLPSRVEGLPVVFRQAMASGCAIICTLPFEFEGVQLSSLSPEGLVQAIRQLWSAKEQTLAMGRQNVRLSQEYSWDLFTSSLLATYDQVLRER